MFLFHELFQVISTLYPFSGTMTEKGDVLLQSNCAPDHKLITTESVSHVPAAPEINVQVPVEIRKLGG